ncbi:MAG: agmatinase [Candidatus Micrarchaeota archaeon]|nr:agmatinase [Candidatus Micrarchaeota archaeon]
MATKVPFNFGGLPKEYSSPAASKVAVLPIPFDGTSTWGKGADKGPAAIIEASRHMELYDIETDSEAFTVGISTEKPVKARTVDKMVEEGYLRARRLLNDGKFVVCLGGEHSISIGPIRAHAEHYGDISILHLDAHSDRRTVYEGSKYNHACVIARAGEYCKNIVSVGIRSMDSSEVQYIDRRKVFFAHEIHGSTGWVQQAIRELNGRVYITIDLDVFDPGIMPSTGTPEPGGLGWYDVIGLLREVAKQKEIVGLDVVELAPNKHNAAPDFLAAKLVYSLLSYKGKFSGF